MTNEKMRQTAHHLDTVVKIYGIANQIFALLAIIDILFTVLTLIRGEALITANSHSLGLDFVTLRLTDGSMAESGWLSIYAIAEPLANIIHCLVIWRGTVLLRRILAPMKACRPFDNSVLSNLLKLALLVLVGGALIQFSDVAKQMILAQAYPLDEILSSPIVAQIEYNYSPDLNSVLLLFLMLIFLYYIFTYGQQLQQEADETL